jgi:inorganic pyrophosphatase
MPNSKTLHSPASIKPFATGQKSLWVVIETPKGSRNKFKFDDELGCYRLNAVLPEGMDFPFDFGFVPQTRAQDGDPLDVLLLMDQPAFPGILVEARIVGVIEAEQTEDGKTTRNDRILAVSTDSHTHSDIKKPKNLNDTMLRELEQFFVAYNREHGKKFKLLGLKGAKTAMRLIKKSRVKKAA